MSSILSKTFDSIPNPYLLVCEGFGDVRFVDALLDHRGILNCNIGCPTQAGGHGDGKDSIPQYLKAARAVMQKGKAELRGVLIIIDSDDSPESSFKFSQDALSAAGFKKPSVPYIIEEEHSFRTGCLPNARTRSKRYFRTPSTRCSFARELRSTQMR